MHSFAYRTEFGLQIEDLQQTRRVCKQSERSSEHKSVAFVSEAVQGCARLNKALSLCSGRLLSFAKQASLGPCTASLGTVRNKGARFQGLGFVRLKKSASAFVQGTFSRRV